MTPAEIEAEHRRGQRLRQKHLDAFGAAGVPALNLAKDWRGHYGFVMRDRVVFEGRRFEFKRYSDHGEPAAAYTVVVLDWQGTPADVAAFSTGRLALWLGAVSALGMEQVYLPRMGDPLTVHPTPLDWLRAARRGIVISDPLMAAHDLRDAGTLAAATVPHGQDLRTMLTIPAPPIVVGQDRALAA